MADGGVTEDVVADGGVTEDVVTAGAAAPDGGPPSTSAPTPSTRAAPSADEAGFRAWAAHRMPVLRRRAFLLCGDLHTADDLVQETLVRVYARWHRVAGGPDPDAYAGKVLLTRFLDTRRRPWRRERTVASVPDQRADAAATRAFEDVDAADATLAAALAAIPADQRAVLVLRFADDLAVEQVARQLDISSGTVKSRTSRGLANLRAELARLHHPAAEPAAAPESQAGPEPVPHPEGGRP